MRRKQNSIFAGIFFGILMVLGAFAALWFNEGRTNFADVAQDSVIVAPDTVHGGGELIAITGKLVTGDPISDDRFLRPANYAFITRDVEMYAWEEKEESSDEDSTSYTYETVWTDDPMPTSQMVNKAGHDNPALPFTSGDFAANGVTLGAYEVDMLDIAVPTPNDLALSNQNVQEGNYSVTSEYVFVGKGTLSAPTVGDVRVSFGTINEGTLVTVFAENAGNSLQPHVGKDGRLYRMLYGTRDEAIAQLDTEYTIALWGFRALGFFLMWGGFAAMLSPLNRIFSFIPGADRLGRMLTGGISFLIAAPLALITIIVSFLLHNILALIAILLLVGAGIFFWQRNRTTGKMA